MSDSSKKSFAVRHPLLTGMAAGLAAAAVSGVCDRLSDRMVSKDQKKRDRRVRKAPAHKLAGPYFAEKIVGRRLSQREQKRAQFAFNVLYGLGWGMIHSKLRRKFPFPIEDGGGSLRHPVLLCLRWSYCAATENLAYSASHPLADERQGNGESCCLECGS